MKAITTKYIGATNTKGSRIKAQASKGQWIYFNYDHALNSSENHVKAAETLAKKLGWNVILADGYAEHLNLGVHVIVGRK